MVTRAWNILLYLFKFCASLWRTRLSVRTSIFHPQSFSDLDIIWCLHRPEPDMCNSMTLTRFKVKFKVTELPNFQKLHFPASISSAILAWSSKLMADYDNVGPNLQPIGARFLNVLLSKLSRDFKLRRMSILQDFYRAMSLMVVVT